MTTYQVTAQSLEVNLEGEYTEDIILSFSSFEEVLKSAEHLADTCINIDIDSIEDGVCVSLGQWWDGEGFVTTETMEEFDPML